MESETAQDKNIRIPRRLLHKFIRVKRVNLKHIPLKPVGFTRLPEYVHKGFYVLFLLSVCLVIARIFFSDFLGLHARWPDGAWILAATGVTLAGLGRRLPEQNVILASAVIALIASASIVLGAKTGIPFGPFTFQKNMGSLLFDPLPAAAPLIWIVAIINARGVARLALRPVRTTRNYGFWLLGITTLLTVLFDANLEPFATQVRSYWTWSQIKMPLNWYSTPWSNFMGWTVTCLLILGFATPTLISKKPAKQLPDYHPLVVWCLLNLCFALGAYQHHLWYALALDTTTVVVSVFFALRGASW